MRPETQGFQKPIDSGKRRKVRMAIVKTSDGTSSCSCGWQAWHRRTKVLEDKIDAHLAKHHQGKGLRL